MKVFTFKINGQLRGFTTVEAMRKDINELNKLMYNVTDIKIYEIKTLKGLIKLIGKMVYRIEDIKEHCISDLITSEEYKIIENFSDKYTITKKQIYAMNFEGFTSKEVKTYLLLDCLNYGLDDEYGYISYNDAIKKRSI